MNSQLTKEQLIGEFEEVFENDKKIIALEEQIKVIKLDSKDRLTDFAKDNEIKSVKYVTDNYKRWKAFKLSGKNPDEEEDFYTLMNFVDEAISEEASEDQK
jgi:ATP-dependent Clp protease adapter protein ClpS